MEPQGDGRLLEFTKEEVTYEDHDRPNLVVRRSMLTPKTSKSDCRETILLKLDVLHMGGFGMLLLMGEVVRILFLKKW